MAREAAEIHRALTPYGLTRLGAAQAWMERKNDTWKADYGLDASYRNPWCLKGPNGGWMKFETYADAATAYASRITAPWGAYAPSKTVREFLEIYAPQSDGNSVDDYCAVVCREIDALPLWKGASMAVNKWNVAGMTAPIELPTDIFFEQRLIPVGQKNQRPGLPMDWIYYTQHDTGNRNAGANAEMHWRWLLQGAPGGDSASGQVGFHFVTDDRMVLQLVPVNEVAWHAGDGGDGPGNRRSIGIEKCVNVDANAEKANWVAAHLAAAMLRARGLPADRLRSHWSWVAGTPGAHYCPDSLLSSGQWASWANQVAGLVVNGPAAPTWPGKPAWLPDGLVNELFPEATPNGPRTATWLAYCGKVGKAPRRVKIHYPGTANELIEFSDGLLIDKAAKIVGAA